jgi:predicted DNA-binding WGR domain protein
MEMCAMDYKFIGWNTRDGADKVWGAIYMEDRTNIRPKVLIFWGRRGKKLQTKMDREGWDLDNLIREKTQKGYNQIDNRHLKTVYPEFQNDLEKTTMWALLKL